MTPDLFDRVARALYGDQFVAPLAADLDVNKRTVARWASGKSRIPPALADALVPLVVEAQEALAAARAELDVAISEQMREASTAPRGG